jgi:hypothetical protein
VEDFEEIAFDKQITNPLNGTDMSTTLSWFGHMEHKFAAVSSSPQQH